MTHTGPNLMRKIWYQIKNKNLTYCLSYPPEVNNEKKCKARTKKVVLFTEIGRVKFFSRPDSRMCIRIYIFNFKKQTNKQ